MKLTKTVKTSFRKYASFKGTANRSEYWLWMVFVMVVLGLVTIVEGALVTPMRGDYLAFDQEAGRPLFWAFVAVLALPTVSATVRRFHDSAKSGWFMLACIIIAIAWLALVFRRFSIFPAELMVSLGSLLPLELLYGIGFLPLLYYLAKRGAKHEHKYTEL